MQTQVWRPWKTCFRHTERYELRKDKEFIILEYQRTIDLFGEASSVPPEQFYEYVVQFMDVFDSTVKEIDDAKMKEVRLFGIY